MLEESKLFNIVTSSVAVNKTRFSFITGELCLLNNKTVAFTCTMYTLYNLLLHDVCDRRQGLLLNDRYYFCACKRFTSKSLDVR